MLGFPEVAFVLGVLVVCLVGVVMFVYAVTFAVARAVSRGLDDAQRAGKVDPAHLLDDGAPNDRSPSLDAPLEASTGAQDPIAQPQGHSAEPVTSGRPGALRDSPAGRPCGMCDRISRALRWRGNSHPH